MKALYRIVAAVAALLAFPALYFLKLIRIVMELGFADGYFDDAFSVEDVVNFIRDYGIELNSESIGLSENVIKILEPLKAPGITALVFLCLAIVMVLAVFFCSALTNAKKINLIFSALGGIAVIGAIASFNSMTDIVISGELPLSTIIDEILKGSGSTIASIAGLLGAGSLTSVIGELKILQLSSAVVTVLLIFIFEIIWTLSFILISLDEVKTPKTPKATKKK
ncbi:MAG: hypothetical protein IJE63_00255 [Clostridia bacterium]|nr:hypothetical protein [Clostridia bacterium]MBQ7100822.1 hypothetical protein [Clostridia bacterium]